MVRLVPIEIHGVTYNLRYRNSAIAALEARVGMGISRLFTSEMSFLACQQLLYTGLKHKEDGGVRTLTMERAGELMDDYADQYGGIEGLVQKELEALRACGVIQGGDDGDAAASGDGENPTTATSPSPT